MRPLPPAVLLIALSMAACFALAACEEAAADAASLPSTERPADAVVLPQEVGPVTIISEVRTDPSMLAAFVDAWIDEKGWQGEVLKVRRRGGITTFSVAIQESTVPGDVVVVAEAPGDETVEEGGLARFSGRITGVEPSTNLKYVPHKVLVDRVTVRRFSKAR